MLRNKPVENLNRSFLQRLFGLISDPAFIKFSNLQNEPNIFRIVGRTHYERWHSAFWGWLLDVKGSHLLGDYVLTRFLYLLLDDRCLKAATLTNSFLLNHLPALEFSNVEVAPNENISVETSIKDVGRFDIFLTSPYIHRTTQGRLNLLVELKIDSPIRQIQSLKYADWLLQNHPNDINIPVYIIPSLLTDSRATVGDDRWYCLTYQLVNDKILLPILDHPNLNDKVRPFIVQYIKNLSFRSRGLKMAITDEEKLLALELYEKYSEVFDSIYDVLQSEGIIEYTTSFGIPKGRVTGKLAVKIDDRVFQSDTLRRLLREVLIYIVDSNYIARIPLPWGNSPKRFIITNEDPPTHPNGKPFFYPESYQGYTIETHYARDRGLKVLNDLCQRLEIDYEAFDV